MNRRPLMLSATACLGAVFAACGLGMQAEPEAGESPGPSIGTPEESLLPNAKVPPPIREQLGGYVAVFQKKDFFKLVDSSATYVQEGSYTQEVRRWSDMLHRIFPKFDQGARGKPIAAYAAPISTYWWAASGNGVLTVGHLRGERIRQSIPGELVSFIVAVPHGDVSTPDGAASGRWSSFIGNVKKLLEDSESQNEEVKQSSNKDRIREATPVVVNFLRDNDICPAGSPVLKDIALTRRVLDNKVLEYVDCQLQFNDVQGATYEPKRASLRACRDGLIVSVNLALSTDPEMKKRALVEFGLTGPATPRKLGAP